VVANAVTALDYIASAVSPVLAQVVTMVVPSALTSNQRQLASHL
jgi:hypothetical protein